MKEYLRQEEQDIETHLSYILSMAGFSFSGLLAVAILDVTLQQDFRIAVFYLFLSFLFFMSSLNIQGYKYIRWRDHLAMAFTDSAFLSLILSILSILYIQKFRSTLTYTITILSILIWAIDFLFRLQLDIKFLKVKKEVKMSNGKRDKGWYESREEIRGRNYCKKHKISYPYGSTCPKCDKEKKK